jgi:hypothetical protein
MGNRLPVFKRPRLPKRKKVAHYHSAAKPPANDWRK